jgi:hypothetical protein
MLSFAFLNGSSSDSLKLLHALDAEWIKVAKEEIKSQSISIVLVKEHCCSSVE